MAIACLTIGYDFMIGNCDSFCGKIKDFFWRWLSLLYKRIEEKKEVKDKIQGVYRKILNSYSVYIMTAPLFRPAQRCRRQRHSHNLSRKRV